jgi:hypothetical protein
MYGKKMHKGKGDLLVKVSKQADVTIKKAVTSKKPIFMKK